MKSYISVYTVAQHLNCHAATVWRHARETDGFPKPVRVGGMTRWVQDEVNEYLAAREAEREAA